MNQLRNLISRLRPPVHTLPAGIYQYQSPAGTEPPYRLHLRLEPDGTGLLILNASTVLHLNQTAAEYAYHVVQQTPLEEVVKVMAARYNVRRENAEQDFLEFRERLQALVTKQDLDPVTFLDFERNEPYSSGFSAPLRLDCALTYRMVDETAHQAAPVERVKRELVTQEWETILQKAWQAGIPHVIFTGGEPTTRPDLPELIQAAERLGMVAGVMTGGYRLSETTYLHQLLQAGLDHLMIVWDPEDDECCEAMRDVMAEDIFVSVHLTITPRNVDTVEEQLKQLQEMGVSAVSLSISNTSFAEALQKAREVAAHLGISLVWDLPVPYSALNPVALETQESSRGAGKAWLYVEPDGDVLPSQGINEVLGNLLQDPWETIWTRTQSWAG